MKKAMVLFVIGVLLVGSLMGCQNRRERHVAVGDSGQEVVKVEPEKVKAAEATTPAPSTSNLSGGEASISPAPSTPKVSGEALIPPSPPSPNRPNEGELAARYENDPDIEEWDIVGDLESCYKIAGKKAFVIWTLNQKGERTGTGKCAVMTRRTKGDTAKVRSLSWHKVHAKIGVKYYDKGEGESYYEALWLEITPTPTQPQD